MDGYRKWTYWNCSHLARSIISSYADPIAVHLRAHDSGHVCFVPYVFDNRITLGASNPQYSWAKHDMQRGMSHAVACGLGLHNYRYIHGYING